MKKKMFLVLLLILLINDSNAQVAQGNFTGVTVPQYICSGTSTRLPYIYRATVSGLLPNTYYRYYLNACVRTDFGSTNSGAGNPLFINGSNFRYSTSTSLSTYPGYDSLLTNANGTYTGWFGFVHTGNTRFTAGNYIYPTITLDSAGSGVAVYRFALSDSIKVLSFATAVNSTSSTGLYGISFATPKNIITTYDNTDNTGRPLTVAFVESDGIDTVAMPSLVKYYKDSVDSRNGRWGTFLPNMLPGGLKRINVLRLSDGEIIRSSTDSDGIWPSGTNTVNPAGGTDAPLRLDASDAPLLILNSSSQPDNFSLGQNYPNPFNPITNIDFSIPSNGFVKLVLYDVLGKEVTVISNKELSRGSYTAQFDAGNLVSGVYFYSIEFSGENGIQYSDRKKLVLIK